MTELKFMKTLPGNNNLVRLVISNLEGAIIINSFRGVRYETIFKQCWNS